MLRVVPLLLLSCLTEAAFLDEFDPAAAVKGLPGAMRDNFRIFRVGIGAMWNNRQAAGAVRKRLAQGCEPVAYPDLLLMRKSADDSQKLLQAGLIYLVMPEVLPAMLYFFPSSLPSTFETDKGRAKRHDTLVRLRAKAVLQLACQIEEDAATKTGKKGLLSAALCSKAEAVLKGASAARAVAPLAAYLPPPADAKEACEVAKAPLKGLPGPFIKAGCTLIGLSGPLPGPIRRQPLSPLAPRQSLRKHLSNVAAEDAALRSSGLAGLSRSQLLEAAFDRGFGAPSASDAQLRAQLTDWLSLLDIMSRQAMADMGEPKREPDPTRLRLAAMAASAVGSARHDEVGRLPRLLYSKAS